MTAPRRRIRSGASWRCRIIGTPVRPGTSRRWPTPSGGRSRIPTLYAGSPITPRPSITTARGARPGSLPRRHRGNELRRLRVPARRLNPRLQSLGTRLTVAAGGAAAHLDTHERDVRQAALLVQVVLAGGLHLMATLGALHRIDLIAWISRLSQPPGVSRIGMPRRPIFAEHERDSARSRAPTRQARRPHRAGH